MFGKNTTKVGTLRDEQLQEEKTTTMSDEKIPRNKQQGNKWVKVIRHQKRL